MVMLSDKIILVGGGGHCKSVIESIRTIKNDVEIKITDYNLRQGDYILGCEVIGTDDMLFSCFQDGFAQAVITVGSIKSTENRYRAYWRAEKAGFDFPAIIDEKAVLAHSVKVGKGVFVGKNTVLNAQVFVDDFAIINTASVIEHECRVGKFAHIAVGAILCGSVEVGDNVFVGAGSTIIQGVRIGMNSIIGAGSIVLKDVPDNTTVVGVWGGVFLIFVLRQYRCCRMVA